MRRAAKRWVGPGAVASLTLQSAWHTVVSWAAELSFSSRELCSLGRWRDERMPIEYIEASFRTPIRIARETVSRIRGGWSPACASAVFAAPECCCEAELESSLAEVVW